MNLTTQVSEMCCEMREMVLQCVRHVTVTSFLVLSILLFDKVVAPAFIDNSLMQMDMHGSTLEYV